MQIQQIITNHTTMLIKSGIFDHLSELDLSLIHHKLIYGIDDNAGYKFIFKTWRIGNFCDTLSHLQLLQQTNALLINFGESIIDEDFLEEIID